jgi:hypothetical protein
MTGNEHEEEPPDESELLERENEGVSGLEENTASGTDDIDSSGRRKPSQPERRSSRFWLGFLLRR